MKSNIENMNNTALVIDSNYKYSDLWKMYFGQLNKFFNVDIKRYLFTDISTEEKSFKAENLLYDNNDSYRNQILKCLQNVKEEYIIYNSEDYILYDFVKIEEIQRCIKELEKNKQISFIKFIKGPENTILYNDEKKFLKEIDPEDKNLFAQQAGIWRTETFKKIFENSPASNGRMQQEPGGSDICKKLKIRGLQHFSPSSAKRGIVHWDSWIFPYIATAVCKGKWNISEYKNELIPLFYEYNIDYKIRGII